MSVRTVSVERFAGGACVVTRDAVAVEEPLEIRLGFGPQGERAARSVSITMRTPGDDLALALGFLWGEGIVRGSADVLSVEHCGPPAPDSGSRNVVRVELAPHAPVALERLARHFYTTSSCGVCGKSSLAALATSAEKIATAVPAVDPAVLCTLPDALRARQSVFERTGGLHAAALFDADGALEIVCEDVGRHNAVDKLVGKLVQQDRLPADDRGLLVSGRASFELVQKAIMAGIPMLAAVGAPSSLAIGLAEEFGLELIGFLRAGRYNRYSGGNG